MSNHRHFARHFASSLLIVTSLAAQTVHTVGTPAGFADIQPAIAAAAPGDIIMVHPGSYGDFNMQIGVSIIAVQTGTVTITSAFHNVISIPAGQAGHFVGVNLERPLLIGGHVTFDQVRMESHQIGLRMLGGTCHLQDCTLRALPFLDLGGNPSGAIEAHGGTITAIDCNLTGGTALDLGGSPIGGRQAIWLESGVSFLGSGLSISVGPGPNSSAALYSESPNVWLNDSLIISAPPICAIDSPAAECDRCIITGPCTTGPGQPIGHGPVLGVQRNTPLFAGLPFTIDFLAQPNEFVLVFGSHGLATTPYPELAQAFLLDPVTCFPAAALVADATGHVSASWNVPSAPLPVGSQVWLQGVAGFAFPLQTSPVVGGLVR